MDLETIREHALGLGAVTEDFPFDQDTLAFRVGEKIFLLASLEKVPAAFNAKCDPEKAIELRERYQAIQPGYHMNKKHWNTITLDGTVPRELVLELVEHSWSLVASSLPKRKQKELGITT